MLRELSCHDDVSLVTGLKKKDKVLLVGGNLVLPEVKKYVASVTQARKQGELDRLIKDERTFDKVFVARENVLDEVTFIKAAQLTAKGGMFCFLSEDETMRQAFEELVVRNFPSANIWNFQTNVGSLVMTDARGNPDWME